MLSSLRDTNWQSHCHLERHCSLWQGREVTQNITSSSPISLAKAISMAMLNMGRVGKCHSAMSSESRVGRSVNSTKVQSY